jgi:hypothetical protein
MTYGTNTIQRLIGFHVVWHLFGGREALKAAGWPERTVDRNRVEFYKVFGVPVEDAFPEISEAARGMRP